MSWIRKRNPCVISLECETVARWLAAKPNRFLEKKGHELWVAWLLCRFYYEKLGIRFCIGLPVSDYRFAQQDIDALDLDEVVNSARFVKDKDADFILGNTSDESHAYQVTRVVASSDHPKRKDVKELLAQKCAHQPDENLSLVISINDQIVTDTDELEAWICGLSVPYDTTWLIGATTDRAGEFTAIKLHPSPRLEWTTQFRGDA